jgi:hypothetical protein
VISTDNGGIHRSNWMDDARQLPVPTIPKVASIGLKLLGDGHSHLIE